MGPQLTDSGPAGDGDAGNDGLPDADAGTASVTVAKYAYNADGTLQATWDPRVGDGAAALKTAYEYASTTTGTGTAAVTKVRITKVTAPGQQPWQVNYSGDGVVTTITRPLDAAVGAGNATWTIRYGIGLAAEGDGLPNLSGAKTAAWGQAGPDAPVAGAAVFGPDRVPAGTPSATDWSYADLCYWDQAGRETNTASYGAGAWQIASTRYDEFGNQIWSLTPGQKAAALAGAATPADSAAAADMYASHTLFNATGDRVEAEYGPMVGTQVANGTYKDVRRLTRYVYDGENGSIVAGRPTTGVPSAGFGLVTEILTSATDETAPGQWAVGAETPPAGASTQASTTPSGSATSTTPSNPVTPVAGPCAVPRESSSSRPVAGTLPSLAMTRSAARFRPEPRKGWRPVNRPDG